jgi:hypothetical protein
LPAPPIHIPLDLTALITTGAIPRATTGMGQRERAIGRIEERLTTLAGRLAPLWPAAPEWESERAHARLVAPLLTLLGYRRSDQRPAESVRGRAARVLSAGDTPALLLEVTRPAHTLADADARSTLARAVMAGIPWVLLTNGHELRLYSTMISGSTADPGRALILRIDPHGWADEASRLDTARQLWLLSRDAVAAGSLDAYLAARAVGAALLSALDDSHSPLVGALSEAVHNATGLELPLALLARQARLAVRGPRGRDGEPLPGDIPAVAAVLNTLPSGVPEPYEEVRTA